MVGDRNASYLAPAGIGALWLATQVGLLFYGPAGQLESHGLAARYGVDTPRYLKAAGSIMAGSLPAGKAQGFLGYDLFVAFFLGSGLGEVGLILAQSLLSLLAAYCLYRIGLRLYDRRVGLLAALVYATYPLLQFWNFYILAESLFVSMAVICLFLVLEARGWWRTALACAAVAFTTTLRPNGVVVALAAASYLAYKLLRRRRFYLLGAAACALVLAAPVAAEVFGGLVARYDLLAHLAEGRVVGLYPESGLLTAGPLPPGIHQVENPLYQALVFIGHKPLFFLQLVFWRLWYMFAAVRPRYSAPHNYFLVMTMVPTYLLAAWGVLQRAKAEAGRLLLVSLVGFQCLTVALTFVDSDNRVLLVVLPVSFLLASRGAWGLWDKARAAGARPVSGRGPRGGAWKPRAGPLSVAKE